MKNFDFYNRQSFNLIQPLYQLYVYMMSEISDEEVDYGSFDIVVGNHAWSTPDYKQTRLSDMSKRTFAYYKKETQKN